MFDPFNQIISQPEHSGSRWSEHHTSLERTVESLTPLMRGASGSHGKFPQRIAGVTRWRHPVRHPAPLLMTLLPPVRVAGRRVHVRRRAKIPEPDCDSTLPSRPFLLLNYRNAHLSLEESFVHFSRSFFFVLRNFFFVLRNLVCGTVDFQLTCFSNFDAWNFRKNQK
jgi:hypothetical protein